MTGLCKYQELEIKGSFQGTLDTYIKPKIGNESVNCYEKCNKNKLENPIAIYHVKIYRPTPGNYFIIPTESLFTGKRIECKCLKNNQCTLDNKISNTPEEIRIDPHDIRRQVSKRIKGSKRIFPYKGPKSY